MKGQNTKAVGNHEQDEVQRPPAKKTKESEEQLRISNNVVTQQSLPRKPHEEITTSHLKSDDMARRVPTKAELKQQVVENAVPCEMIAYHPQNDDCAMVTSMVSGSEDNDQQLVLHESTEVVVIETNSQPVPTVSGIQEQPLITDITDGIRLAKLERRIAPSDVNVKCTPGNAHDDKSEYGQQRSDSILPVTSTSACLTEEHWQQWLRQKPVINVESMTNFIGGAIEAIPLSCRRIVTRWLVDAVKTATTVDWKNGETSMVIDESLVNPEDMLQEGPAEIMRVRCTRLISEDNDVELDANITDQAVDQISEVGHAETTVADCDVQNLPLACRAMIVDRSIIGQNCETAGVASTPDVTAIDESPGRRTETQCCSEPVTTVNQGEENTSSADIDEELALCNLALSQGGVMDVQCCERILSTLERYKDYPDKHGVAKLMAAAFLSGDSRYALVVMSEGQTEG